MSFTASTSGGSGTAAGVMDLSEFRLSEEQFERLRPLLPDTVRCCTVDDRRVISGIIHIVK